jgi:hypothetical protein
MKTKKIAAAVLVPAAVAGVTLSSWAAVSAATDHPASSQVVRHQAVRASGQHAATTAQPSDGKKARGAGAVPSWWLDDLHAAVTKAQHRARAAARQAAAPAAPSQPAATSSTSLSAGMSAFETCVAWRESGDNPTASSAGLFGILPATWQSLGYPGTAGEASVAMQKAAFSKLYAADGTQPWAPYDGC